MKNYLYIFLFILLGLPQAIYALTDADHEKMNAKVVRVASADSAQPAASAAQERITVEAEGSGDSKMAALKDAWTNAVRQAVGMYLASNSSVKSDGLDDKYAEEIAAYSRGQVNSFETLSETSENGIWTIKIRANVDKDILQETVAASQSQSVKVDGANLAAQIQSVSDKKKNAEEVLFASGLLDFKNCLDYQAKLVKYEIDGKTNFFMQHTLKFNLEKFNKQSGELETLIAQIVPKKMALKFSKSEAENIFKLIKQKDYNVEIDFKEMFNNHNNNYPSPISGFIILNGLPAEYSSMMQRGEGELYGIFENYPISFLYGSLLKNELAKPASFSKDDSFSGFSVENPWCFVHAHGRADCYEMKKDLPIYTDNRFELVFTVTGLDDEQTLEIPTFIIPPLPNTSLNRQLFHLIAPEFMISFRGSSKNIPMFELALSPIIIVLQKLDVSTDELVNIQELKGSYELIPSPKSINIR